jgi:FkbM family methyltransferase
VEKYYITHLCKTLYGDTLEAFKDDYITREILDKGIYSLSELTILASLFSLMPSKKVCLDVGGNIGNHCGLFSRHFEITHTIEPHFEVFSILAANIKRNKWRAQAHNIAFSDREGNFKLYISEDGNLGKTTLVASDAARSIEIEAKTGDRFVQENNLGSVDFIKIDTESFEGQTIAGLSSTISSCQPVISMEWNNALTKCYFEEHSLFSTVLEDGRISDTLSFRHASPHQGFKVSA